MPRCSGARVLPLVPDITGTLLLRHMAHSRQMALLSSLLWLVGVHGLPGIHHVSNKNQFTNVPGMARVERLQMLCHVPDMTSKAKMWHVA